MSSQPPYDPSYPSASFGQADPSRSAAPAEYIPLDPAPFPAQPMQRPAYLYPLLYTPVAQASSGTISQEPWPSQILAMAGFILGIMGIFLWLFSGLGSLVSILGLVFSILGWRPPARRWMVIFGCAFSAAALALSIYNSDLGSRIFPR